jgi:hypothetical protein
LLLRRQGPLLRGMWEPPILDVRSATSLRTAGDRVSSILRGHGVRTSLTPMTGRIRHRITHRDIVVGVWTGRARAMLAVRSDVRWVRIDRPAVPMTGLGRKLVRAARSREAEHR